MNTQKTLKELSVVELKAVAYDNIRSIERLQNGVQAINEELTLRANVEPKVEEVKPE